MLPCHTRKKIPVGTDWLGTYIATMTFVASPGRLVA
jgi:hypothetical protein